MSKFRKIFSPSIVKAIVVGLVLLFALLFYFKEDIKEHKVTKAKMEMFKRMLKTEPEEWPGEFKEVYDSMIVIKEDSIPSSQKSEK
ncbi:MAG: hypothetical protein P1U56_13080 [Saprospiraceae bacterium]|nr:hypothetical protein [Saprospiraceae bacterium]